MVGQIIYTGSKTKGFTPGERVTLATTIACGNCLYCSRGLGNICPDAKPISYDFDGAFAEYMEVPAMAVSGGNIIKVPDSVTDEAATLCEPLSCAVNAQELAGVKDGDRVLIIDDLLATGGTAKAAVNLFKKLGGNIVGTGFVIELGFLKGRNNLEGVDIFSIIKY